MKRDPLLEMRRNPKQESIAIPLVVALLGLFSAFAAIGAIWVLVLN